MLVLVDQKYDTLLHPDQGQLSVTESVAEIRGLNDATPAPTISVPEDTTAALVAMPDVGLSARPPTSVGPATVVINTNARWNKEFSRGYNT